MPQIEQSMFPRNAYGNPQRPYQLVTNNGVFLGEPVQTAYAGRIAVIKNVLVAIYNTIAPHLPEGCPVILGGGFIRDAIFGAPIHDIDVWVPQDATLTRANINGVWNTVFHSGNLVRSLNSPYSGGATRVRDVTNEWVVEGTIGGIPINIMKTLVRYNNNPQNYFTELNRGFDTEISMMFMGLVGQSSRVNNYEALEGTSYVIIPSSLKNYFMVNGGVNPIPLTAIGFNPTRVAATSQTRMEARIAKLKGKYRIRGDLQDTLTYYSMSSEDLEAVPVSIQTIMSCQGFFPLVNEQHVQS